MEVYQQQIEIDQVARQTQSGEWIRGKAYFRNGRVERLEETCLPSGQRSVRAVVRAADFYSGRLIVSSRRDCLSEWQCSCPLNQSQPCRHIIAILLQSMQDADDPGLRSLLAAQTTLSSVQTDTLQTDVLVLFRYQKQTDRILVMPRVIKRNADGQKIMSTNPLDPDDVTINSQVADRMALLRDRTTDQQVISFFHQWADCQDAFVGCLTFNAGTDLPILVEQILPALPEDWRVLYDSEFEKLIPARKSVTAEFSHLRRKPSGLLTFNLSFHCEKLSITPEQLADYLAGQQKWLLVNGQFIEITNKKQLARMLEHLANLRLTDLDLDRFEAEPAELASLVLHEAETAEQEKAKITFDASFAEMRAGLTSDQDNLADAIPELLDQILRPYQRTGVQWLLFLGRFRMGGILADDMGLGKTLQVLVALAAIHRTRPALIVCPKTLLFNWQNEARRFTPALKTVLVHGPQDYRRRLLRQAYDFDLLVTSYPLIQRDINQYEKLEFDCCILDEAQMIKNPETHLARHVKKIKARQRIALTGTPLENNIMDLWSIFDFILPGYLGRKDAFRIQYAEANQEKLLPRIKPFLLRRTKVDVLPELPNKIEETLYAPLTQNQLALYHQTLTQIRKKISESIDSRGLAQSRMAILAGLTRLRQISNHPGLLHEAYRSVQGISGKFELFDELLQTLLANGHKVLVFSQFTRMLAILSRRLQDRQIPFCYLDGQTQDRQQVIREFNRATDIPVFLISLKAGGFGLNLTSADTVILFDPWWNPMVEDQAADRVHRFGQKKVVTIYRLISQGTIEEKMEGLQARKRLTFDRVINRAGSPGDRSISTEDLKALLDADLV
ncbi:MAG: DEAD/DEAH box helicase [Bacillota bacterium]|nr:DEAD/DEAH box helicase [Bacillota bacterium]